jgi:LmbE family N-acetylglucosaminyl deacetylase
VKLRTVGHAVQALAASAALGASVLVPLSCEGQAVSPSAAQPASAERGAAASGSLVAGLGVSARALMIGAHPDDEDTGLITWLARGRHVQTAYLSLTRGDGGQNLIGNELGESLGAIRTEELLAARRVDGAAQYFTRAYDYGFSKSAEEAFRHWPHDTLLGDVVRVVRAFRPQLMIAVFSGTPQDGHGQHQASAILAREAYDAALDTVKYPVKGFGPAWAPAKFYRTRTYWGGEGATYTYNVGEYAPLYGRSYGEIASLSRSQHKSQAMGQLLNKGPRVGSLRREESRVNEGTPANQENGLFAGVDTTVMRFGLESPCPGTKAVADSLGTAIREVQRVYSPFEPEAMLAPLARARALLVTLTCGAGRMCIDSPGSACNSPDGDYRPSVADLRSRIDELTAAALGVVVEATVARPVVAAGDTLSVTVTAYNRGKRLATVSPIAGNLSFAPLTVAPDSIARVTVALPRTATQTLSQPWWLVAPRRGDFFAIAASGEPDGMQNVPFAAYTIRALGATGIVADPILYRAADPVRGEIDHPLAVAPAISVTLDRAVEYAQANTPLDRALRVTLRSASTTARTVSVTLALPKGMSADSATRTVTLPAYGDVRTVEFRVYGRLAPGRHTIAVSAESDGRKFAAGYELVDYDHIRPQRIYRPSTLALEAVDVKLPAGLTVAYIRGVGDNTPPILQQLGVNLVELDPAKLSATDLARFGTIVVGTRAYESSPALVANNSRLLDYVRNGGTMIVQYGQAEMQTPGIMPYPITLSRPADRVTDETAPVRITDAASPLLSAPNRIGDADFAGWVQDLTYYMPRTFDAHYHTSLSVNDPGEAPNAGAILSTAYGRGLYVYTTLAFFRELPAGVPGAARLFVNLLAARGAAPGVVQ